MMIIDTENFTQKMLDHLIEMAQPETLERSTARRVAQDSLGRLYDRGIIGLDENLNWFII